MENEVGEIIMQKYPKGISFDFNYIPMLMVEM